MKPRTITFVHDMWSCLRCAGSIGWRDFKTKATVALRWPDRDKSVEALRASHPDKELGRLALTQVVEHFAGISAALDEKPVVSVLRSRAGCR